ncbi:MAG: DUF3536 domain-containing protein [Synergistales bacterium]|nr:DUF3536 domain-containing protein [Synergistales bacterium]
MANPLSICIHGHFYQPPRENPWLDEVELQRTAFPYRNWNERITAECYAPNMAARLFDDKGKITGISNNYSKISFNFGPTLLKWLERNDRRVYEAILLADHEGREYFSGHGPAMAQAYNHMILPLANRRDKVTQVRWGIEDFKYRFKRLPEGMWLPETAVDLETLEVLADQGMSFTVLSPGQASGVRPSGTSHWSVVSGGKIDTTRPYLCTLPSGNSMAIFFYDGEISQEIAFRELLSSGDKFSDRLVSAGTHGSGPVLVSVATDGETYGHHHKFGEMALAYALRVIEDSPDVKLTVFGEYLEKHPPVDEVQIIENTSWSCVHGIGRWKEDCGCHSGSHPSWNQAWRKPLRKGLDWLRDRVGTIFEEVLEQKGLSPWSVRDRYIQVILNRNEEDLDQFFSDLSGKSFENEERVEILKALEMQHKAMLMFTSCGWFFDDISGIEAIQILRYASQAMEYAKELSAMNTEEGFLDILKEARSNDPKSGNGKDIYLHNINDHAFGLARVAAHFGVMTLFEENIDNIPTYCYEIRPLEIQCLGTGPYRLCYGRIRIYSEITLEDGFFSFSSIGLGGHNVVCAVSEKLTIDNFRAMTEELETTYVQGEVSSMIKVLDKYYGSHQYDLAHVFRKEQQQVITSMLSRDLERIDTFLREILEDDYLVMNFMSKINMSVPSQFLKAAEVVIHSDILKELSSRKPVMQRIRESLRSAERWGIPLDKSSLALKSRMWLDHSMDALLRDPLNIEIMLLIREFLVLIREYLWQLNPWHSQNMVFEIRRKVSEEQGEKGLPSKEWESIFREIAELLDISW